LKGVVMVGVSVGKALRLGSGAAKRKLNEAPEWQSLA
jgi:hypothetical protein